MKKAYKCRIYPNQTQQQLLAKNFGCVRFAFNQLLDAVQIALLEKSFEGGYGQVYHHIKRAVPLLKGLKD
ncbi:helix-turn-helix domain-containing protein [Psychrobacillus sp. NEAU-3TGS]|uniref:helix-turn-helix domain-containing protein n=1 Tax=Psychrobacillus sp. NEAU-3TGS TaxID=2995412 RepID=UPI0032B535CD